MKILFAIQGTGNGHISRAREIVPLLQQYGEVDLLVSGTEYTMSYARGTTFLFYGDTVVRFYDAMLTAEDIAFAA